MVAAHSVAVATLALATTVRWSSATAQIPHVFGQLILKTSNSSSVLAHKSGVAISQAAIVSTHRSASSGGRVRTPAALVFVVIGAGVKGVLGLAAASLMDSVVVVPMAVVKSTAADITVVETVAVRVHFTFLVVVVVMTAAVAVVVVVVVAALVIVMAAVRVVVTSAVVVDTVAVDVTVAVGVVAAFVAVAAVGKLESTAAVLSVLTTDEPVVPAVTVAVEVAVLSVPAATERGKTVLMVEVEVAVEAAMLVAVVVGAAVDVS